VSAKAGAVQTVDGHAEKMPRDFRLAIADCRFGKIDYAVCQSAIGNRKSEMSETLC